MNARIRLLAGVCAIISVSGCSTILRGSVDTVRITAPDCSKAMCEVDHSGGTQTISYLPGAAIFDRGWKNISIKCWARGDESNYALADLEATLDGWTFGNLLFGGVVGTAFDISQGSTGKLPDEVTLPLQCND